MDSWDFTESGRADVGGGVVTEKEQRLVETICAAFDGVKLGDGVGLREAVALDEYAEGSVREFYRQLDEKLDWSAISSTDLNRNHISLCYFDAEAMRFHIPAYMVADLRGDLSTHDLLFNLTQVDDDGTKRFAKMSSTQRAAIREYLRLRLSDAETSAFHDRIATALREYWVAP